MNRTIMVERIADYEVLGVLGYGASSTIYAAQDGHDGQVYAIKRVLRRTPTDQRFIDQAITEHDVASQVDHPTLRKSYKVIKRRRLIRTSELLVLMELVDGETLEDCKFKSLGELLRVFVRVTEGLEAMHKQGFLHCDIKPNNILVSEESNVKIIDFGQACPIGTTKQRIQGTPDYIAPEQVLRLPLTAQTDVFNLGATMYWCLTGSHIPTLIPKNNNRIALKSDVHLKTISEFNNKYPIALDKLVSSCLETEPNHRPHSMIEVRDRLAISVKQMISDIEKVG